MCYFNIWILTVGFLWPPSESIHADYNHRCRDKKKKSLHREKYPPIDFWMWLLLLFAALRQKQGAIDELSVALRLTESDVDAF